MCEYTVIHFVFFIFTDDITDIIIAVVVFVIIMALAVSCACFFKKIAKAYQSQTRNPIQENHPLGSYPQQPPPAGHAFGPQGGYPSTFGTASEGGFFPNNQPGENVSNCPPPLPPGTNFLPQGGGYPPASNVSAPPLQFSNPPPNTLPPQYNGPNDYNTQPPFNSQAQQPWPSVQKW